MDARKAWLALFLAGTAVAGDALAHGGSHGEPEPGLGWRSWPLPPLVVSNLLLLLAAYWRGWSRLRRARGRSSGPLARQAASFYSGLGVAAIALVSPVDAFSDVLGWVHMIQHTLLMMVAAPLFVYGSPGYVLLWAVPGTVWSRMGRFRAAASRILIASRYSRPVATSALYGLTLWILHLPLLYEAALRNEWLHDLQHLAFFGSSFLFWRAVLDPYLRRGLHPAVGVLYLFITSLHAMILGALMALSPRAWYSSYELSAPRYGFSALQDQQLAGYIMWMPAGVSFVLVAAVLLSQVMRPRTPAG